jgi:lysophospholipase L1-like esterase
VVISDNAVNDLNNRTPSTSSQLIRAFRQLIRRAHDADVKVICSTLTPFQGTPDWTPAVEIERKRVNAFILYPKSGCDAVLDQAAAVSDPANRAAYLPAYDSGDHLHPNEAGLQAIANALDLDVLHDSSAAQNNTSAR